MTTTTRRTLLRAGALGLVLGPVLLAPVAFAAFTTRRDLYTRERFAALRRRTFRLEAPGRSWRVRLTEVGNLPNAARRDPYSFALTFRADAAGPPQGTYLLTRPGFRPTSLFVVPGDARRRTCQATVFRKP